MIDFPKDFFWGAATSSYQVEGANYNADWWEWEQRVGLAERSQDACRHYELFRQDFDIAQNLRHTAHRFSIEWSRIEPKKGEFSQEALQHYIEVVKDLRHRGIEPIVTLHHFTNPFWFASLGGWLNPKSVGYFINYVQRIISSLAGEVRFWVTINEPVVYIYQGYISGSWPPQKRSLGLARRVMANLKAAHIQAYQLIHDFYRQKNLPRPWVSIAHNMRVFIPCNPNLKNRIAVAIRDRGFNQIFLESLLKRGFLDYIGLNYYSRDLVDIENWRWSSLLFSICEKGHSNLPRNYLGWEIFPEGIFILLERLKKYNLPIFILENGICTNDDSQRWEFIRQHLQQVHRAMQQGANVLGYIYWSLLDNFEWDRGFGPRFGLVEVDYKTFARRVRPSAYKFSEVCATGRLD